MNSQEKLISAIAARLGIDSKAVDTKELAVEIFTAIDSLENRAECVEKDSRHSRRKAAHWRSLAKSCLRLDSQTL